MDEILKKLLESDVLSEETKAELQEQFKSAVDTFLSEERAKLEQQITAQLTEEFVTAQEQLTEALDVKIDTFLAAEFDELKEDINKFRDLEVEYAEKLVEEKEILASQLSEELDQLVDKLDAFLEVRLDEEFAELKEDIAEVKKLEFGRRIFEAMESEFRKHRVSDTSKLESELAEVKEQLDDAKRRIGSMQRERVAEARNSKMEELLSPLSGTAKEQMKIILSNVATEKLDEAYKVYLTRVLKESTVSAVKTEEAKKGRLSESKEQIAEAILVTGNEVSDDADDVETQPDQLSRIRRLAGLA
jgi:hypothetical protein